MAGIASIAARSASGSVAAGLPLMTETPMKLPSITAPVDAAPSIETPAVPFPTITLPAPGDWPLIFAISAGAVFGFPLCTSIAMRHVEAVHASVILGVLPLATALVGAWAHRQRPSWGFWACAALGSALVMAFAPADAVQRKAAARPVAPQPVDTAPKVRVILATSQGNITVEVDREHAPLTAANFLRYVDQRRLDNSSFYRSMRLAWGTPPNGLIQGGVQMDRDVVRHPGAVTVVPVTSSTRRPRRTRSPSGAASCSGSACMPATGSDGTPRANIQASSRAKRLFTFLPAGVSRQAIVFQAFPGPGLHAPDCHQPVGQRDCRKHRGGIRAGGGCPQRQRPRWQWQHQG